MLFLVVPQFVSFGSEYRIEANGTIWTIEYDYYHGDVDAHVYFKNVEQGEGVLLIPSDVSVLGCAVKRVGWTCCRGKQNLTGVVVPDGFCLESGSFNHCNGLTNVVLGASIEQGGRPWPFENCLNIKSLTIGIYKGGFKDLFSASWQNLEVLNLNAGSSSIPSGYCSGMTKLRSVAIPEGFKYILADAFLDCSSLPSVGLPSTMETIGNWAFAWCSSLESIRIPDSVTSIGESAFRYCSALREATLPAGLPSLERYVFAGCSSLTDIVVPNMVESIGDSAFIGCSRLRSARLPDALPALPESLFEGCENLRWVNIPDGIRSVGPHAFADCRSLQRVDLPDGLESIGESAFARCRLVRCASLPDGLTEIGAAAFAGCMGLGELCIPDSVETIGERAFEDCTGLTYLALPPDTTAFGDDLFAGCTRLETVVLPSLLRGNIDWLGIPDGCDVIFYDDTDAVSLAEVGADANRPFSTARRHCRPGADLERTVPGVVTNAFRPGIRRVCTGWTGAGDVPASGTFSETDGDRTLSFRITQDSRLRWQWRTDVRIDLDVEGGSCDFASGWIEKDRTVTVRLSPEDEVFDLVLEGETEGVAVHGTTLTFLADAPRRLSVRMRPRPDFTLTVSSAHGTTFPAAGTTRFYRHDAVAASVAEPRPANGVAFVCTGWRGTGDVPASGSTTNVSFSVSGHSSIEWLWATNIWVGLELAGPVVADEFVWGWHRIGETVVAHYDPAAVYVTYELSGDTNGVAWDRAARTVTIPCDAPRSIRLEATEHTLSTALDSKGFAWRVFGSSPWYPQVEDASDGEDAIRSGDVPGGGCILEADVQGPGTLSWKWKLDASGAGTAGIDLLVDNAWLHSLDNASGWTSASVGVSGEGRHTVRFDFWDAGDDHARGYLDAVAWTGASCSTTNTPAAVPFDWIDGHGLAPRGDYDRAAAGIAANDRSVWECYVAGLDPEDPDADFRAGLVVSNGVPVVTFDPDLGDARVYVVEGKENLTDPWGPTNANTRFFRVKVELKEE